MRIEKLTNIGEILITIYEIVKGHRWNPNNDLRNR